MDSKKEIWKQIPGYENHEASSLGRIRVRKRSIKVAAKHHEWRTYPERILAQQSSRGGHLWVSIRGKTTYVHRLVLMAFFGPPPNVRPHANHRNGVKKNNTPENLEWCSPKENVDHAIATGLRRGKLSFLDAATIRFFYSPQQGKRDATNSILAKIFHVDPSVISRVGRGISLYQQFL